MFVLLLLCRYDYLQFVDENGDKKTFDGVLGDGRWPAKAEFKGSKLHFTFYSDGSNNEWGYKFTVSHDPWSSTV